MSKLAFEDKSYIEIQKAPNDKLFLTVAARSKDNGQVLIANCVELTAEQLVSLIKAAG